jgi:hypothetical protein
LISAGRPPRARTHALVSRPAGRRRQAQSCRAAGQRIGFAQAPPGAARIDKLFPAAYQMFHRLQCAAKQDRRRNHDAGRCIGAHHQPCADGEHRHLHALARDAGQRRQARRRRIEPGLFIEQLLMLVAPCADGAHRHAHADDHFGVPSERLGVTADAA